jgi:hypothetical protein
LRLRHVPSHDLSIDAEAIAGQLDMSVQPEVLSAKLAPSCWGGVRTSG